MHSGSARAKSLALSLIRGLAACSLVIRSKAPWPRYLNLAEVTIYGTDGNQIPTSSLNFKLSSGWYGDSYPAGNCNDGDYSNFCHTSDSDRTPSLTIKYPCAKG
jgi:hypothetical protein